MTFEFNSESTKSGERSICEICAYSFLNQEYKGLDGVCQRNPEIGELISNRESCAYFQQEEKDTIVCLLATEAKYLNEDDYNCKLVKSLREQLKKTKKQSVERYHEIKKLKKQLKEAKNEQKK